MWLTLISFAASLFWVWFHRIFRALAPHDSHLFEQMLTHLLLTTLIFYVASWLLTRFRQGRLDAKKSLES